jgi:hypothetical protein
MPIKKEIVYPIFLECCQYTSDSFWNNIFEDLAYGKSPYGTYISKDFLCCNYKKRDFSYKIERKESHVLYEEVYALLTKKLGLLSNIEKVKKRKAFKDMEISTRESRKEWSDIKKKNIRELLIELYVTRMKEEHSLNIKQARYLLSVIYMAMIFKVITSSDIDYQDGQVQSIQGIDFVNKRVFIDHDIYNIDISFAPEIVMDKKIMADTWEKYLKTLTKIN